MIQYQTLNPYSEIMPGIQTGMQMGQMLKKRQDNQPSDAVIADPGQYKPVDIGQVTAPLEQDITKLGSIEKKMKEVKLPPEARKTAINGYSKSFQNPMIPALAEYGITAEQLNGVLTSVKNGNPDGEGDLKLLMEATNNDPRIIKGLGEMGMKMQQLESQNRQARAQVLQETLENIDKVQANPRAYQGKSGIINPQTKAVVDNELNYVKELAALDPTAAKARLEKIKQRTGGGGALKNFAVMAKNPQTGKIERTPYASSDIMGWKNVPGAVGRTAAPAAAENFVSNVVNKAEIESEQLKPLTQADYDRFMKLAKGDPRKATELAKKENYDTSKVVK